MGLPSVFKSKSSQDKFYITIIVSDSKVQAALWQVFNQEIHIVSKSTAHEYLETKEVAVATDKALQELGKQSENIDQVVFGLPFTWVDNQGVAAARKPLLKALTKDLGLKAMGFVVITEALAKQLATDNPRLSALLVEFTQQKIDVSLIIQGKILATEYVGRSGDTLADMTEALARINAHQQSEITFPGKILLASPDLNQEEMAEQQQSFLAHDWLNSHPFEQMPVVEIVAPALLLEAVVQQGGIAHHPKVKDTLQKDTLPSAVQDDQNNQEFAVEIDSKQTTQNTQAESYGVPVDLSNLEKKKLTSVKANAGVDLAESVKINKKNPNYQKTKMTHWFKEHKKFAASGFIAGLLALGILSFLGLKFGVKAQVELTLKSVPVAKDAIITLSSDGKTDADKLILAATTLDTTLDDKKTKETTGVKVVGDKATGTVTIYNKTDSPKTFEQGTQLNKGDLVFTLEKNVEVASASTTESAGGATTDYGKQTASIVATKIGSDYNLDKKIDLQIASFDPGTYAATVNDEGLSGGSSREVRVVAKADKEQLLKELRADLLKEAKKKITPQLAEGEYIASTSIAKVIEQSFDASVGEEVETVTLELKVLVESLVYQTADLKPLAQKVLADDVPAGYSLAQTGPQILSAPDQEASDSGDIKLDVNISSVAKPDLDLPALKEELLGKKISEAERLLVLNEGIEAAQIHFIPSIAARLYPHLPEDAARVDFK